MSYCKHTPECEKIPYCMGADAAKLWGLKGFIVGLGMGVVLVHGIQVLTSVLKGS